MQFHEMPRSTYIADESQAREIINSYMGNEASRKKLLGLDTETTGLGITPTMDSPASVVVAWSFADEDNRYCAPRKLLPLFKPMLEDPHRTWAMTNAKFDMHMLANSGISLRGTVWDTIVMDWMFDEELRRGRHGLKECARDHMDLHVKSFTDVFKPKRGKGYKESVGEAVMRAFTMDLVNAADYASSDAWVTLRLITGLGQWKGYRRILKQHDYIGSDGWQFFLRYQAPFTRVLYNMERRGFQVWAGYLKSLSGPMRDKLDDYLGTFTEKAGKTVNLGSTKQLREFFFGILDAPVVSETSGGAGGIRQPSTDIETIEEWLTDPTGRVPSLVKEYARILKDFRELSKLRGTYVDGLHKWIDPDTCRIHPTLNQTGTVTGRLSSRDPNLQNIPRPKGDKFGIRHAFVPDEGKVLIVADYGQLEMRLMAHFSGDMKMIQAIRNGLDLHSFTASVMLGVEYDDIIKAKNRQDAGTATDKDEDLLATRQAAKTIGFGLLYGEGPMKLGASLGIPFDEAKALHTRYLGTYPNVKRFIYRTHDECRKNEFVRTIRGRYRRLPSINYDDRAMVAMAERQSVNSIIQGSAADTILVPMLIADSDHELQELGCTMQLQIHDELVFECPTETAELAAKRIKEIMEHLAYDEPLEVDLPVDLHIVPTWGLAK